MLVLTRKVGESILVGDDIEITIVRIDEDQIRIGITAPKDVPVYRKELLEQVQQENIRAMEVLGEKSPETLEALKRLGRGARRTEAKQSGTKKSGDNMEEKK